MDSSKWSQAYTNDDLGRLIKTEQDEVNSWAEKTWVNPPADTTWEWHKPGGSGTDPKMDKLGNWVYWDNDGTTDARGYASSDFFNEVDTRQIGGGNVLDQVHDAAGNLTETDTNNEGTAADERDYTYDYRNRLVKVEDATGLDLAVYSYDGLNRRVRKTTYTGAAGSESEVLDIRYIYDGWPRWNRGWPWGSPACSSVMALWYNVRQGPVK